MPALTALFVVLAIVLWPVGRDRAGRRLSSLTHRDGRQATAIGISQTIAAMVAALRNGATMVQAFEEQAGRRFATSRVSEARAVEALARRADEHEDEACVRTVARQLTAACALSERLGCEASRCMEAVGTSYRRVRLADDRRRETKAGPQATVRLLTGLPVFTVLLGEAMGAHPVPWLFGSPAGWLCLTLGLALYAVGLVWMRRLLESMDAPQTKGRGAA